MKGIWEWKGFQPRCNLTIIKPFPVGWLYHTVPEIASLTENATTKTVELLKLAVGADPSSSQAWYFLGRCHEAQGRAREAFLSYQQAVNKATDNQADIWCSIGYVVLYYLYSNQSMHCLLFHSMGWYLYFN